MRRRESSKEAWRDRSSGVERKKEWLKDQELSSIYAEFYSWRMEANEPREQEKNTPLRRFLRVTFILFSSGGMEFFRMRRRGREMSS